MEILPKYSSAKRLVILFVSTFGSVLLPNAILLLIANTGGLDNLQLFPVLVSVAFYIIILLFFWTRLASWATTVNPDQDVKPVSKDKLKEELLELNNLNLPYKIKEEKDFLTATWNIIDKQWIEILAAKRIKKTHKIKMKLLSNNIVLAQDLNGTFSYEVSPGQVTKINANWSFFRGISLFQYEKGMMGGIIFQDGKLKIGKAYDYQFNLAEMKNPIIEIVKKNGWIYKPVIFFN